MVPALRGENLERNGIFTYFPHNPRVPDWLPPSASVHHGDWKLIRIFHGGEVVLFADVVPQMVAQSTDKQVAFLVYQERRLVLGSGLFYRAP